MLASNDLPFLLVDTLIPLCANVFTDSKIAQKMTLGRTKAMSIVKNILSEAFSDEIVNLLCAQGLYYSIIMDETTNKSSEKPLLHILKPEVEKLVKQISANYMKIDYIRSCKEILKADFTNLDNFIDIKNIYLGIQADKSLKEIKENSNIPDSSIVDFLRTCRAFYIELVTDIVVRFDFSDPIFDIIKIVNPKVAQKFEVKSLNDVFVRFPILCNNVDQQQAD
ncbi:Protein of unknown function, partial [Cotesia congregata]